MPADAVADAVADMPAVTEPAVVGARGGQARRARTSAPGLSEPTTVYAVTGELANALAGLDQLLKQLADYVQGAQDAGRLADQAGLSLPMTLFNLAQVYRYARERAVALSRLRSTERRKAPQARL